MVLLFRKIDIFFELCNLTQTAETWKIQYFTYKKIIENYMKAFIYK